MSSVQLKRQCHVTKIPSEIYWFPWCFRPAEVEDEEYNDFYKSVSKSSDEPIAKIHFTAEGEVTFKSILFVPKSSPNDMFQNYGKKVDGIKVRLMLAYKSAVDTC